MKQFIPIIILAGAVIYLSFASTDNSKAIRQQAERIQTLESQMEVRTVMEQSITEAVSHNSSSIHQQTFFDSLVMVKIGEIYRFLNR